jgi:hypothetical protein
MSLPALLASLLSNEAEAAEKWRNLPSEEGRESFGIPDRPARTLKDLLGSDPTSIKEYNDLLSKKFQNLLKEKGSTPKIALNKLESEIEDMTIHEGLKARYFKDLVNKYLTSQGISPEDQKKFNQEYVQVEKPKSGKFSVGGFGYPAYAPEGYAPDTSVTSETLSPEQKINIWKADPSQFENLSDEPSFDINQKEKRESLMRPVARVNYIADDPDTSARILLHELRHNKDQFLGKKYGSMEPLDKFKVSKNPTLEEVIKNSKSMGHFKDPEVEGKEMYAPFYEALQILKPELFKK